MRERDISYQQKLNELRLDLSHPDSQSKLFLFVEGESDIRLFRKLFGLENYKVEKIPGGKPKVEACVATLLPNHANVLGIKDADFEHLKPNPYNQPNIFLTDYHDIEVTILAQEKILNALVFEYAENIEQSAHIPLQDNILKSIRKVGYIKFLNEIENLEIEFSPGFQDIIDFNNHDLDVDQYISRILQKSPNTSATSESLKAQIIAIEAQNLDLLQLTNGHDFLKTFATYFKNKHGRRGLSEKTLASAIRMTFSLEAFQQTQLYQKIQEWSEDNNIPVS